MKKIFAVIPFLLFTVCLHTQQLNQVTFSDASTLSYFSFLVDQTVLIRIMPDGKVIEWGTEMLSERGNYYAPKLQPYTGRVEYFGKEADSAFAGKVKSIGTCIFTYYGHYETPERAGKLKSIGNFQLDYYNNFDNIAFRGKIKFIGSDEILYYSSVDDEAYRGKLKSIGSTMITYYSTFDDRMIKGKIKSIGSVAYNWYTSFDKPGLGGSLKSGLYRQNIGNITFILR